MKKFILVVFVAILIMLQLPLYTISDMTASVNIQLLLSSLKNGITMQDFGTLLIYIIPILGIVASVVNIKIDKSISLVTAVISVIGILYCGYIYFFATGVGGSVNIGFTASFLCYILALTLSVVHIRTEEKQ